MSQRVLVRVITLAVVTLAGAGACAFEPRTDGSGVPRTPPVTGSSTGASALPGSGQGGGQPATPSPPPTTKPAPKPSGPDTGGCPQGERQREVEGYLAQLGGFGTVTVDGVQSAGDCAAIKKFQQRYGIRPVAGRAGPTTYDVAKRLATTKTGACQAGSGTTVCVNLTLQTVWVIRDGTVVMPPTATRTGMRGYATPAGTFRIDRKDIKEWSNPYQVRLPYWQHFYQGMGFHETTTYIHDKSIGSHGCVNLLHADAVKLWGLTGIGTRVFLLGRRPGT